MNRKEAVDRLSLLKSCLSTQDFIPILKHFCFDSKKVVSYNGIQAASLNFDSGLDCALLGDLLVRLLNSYSSEKIIVEQKKNEVFIKSGNSKTKLALLPSSDFIFQIPDHVKGFERTLDVDFIEGLEKCLISVNDNLQTKNQTGITFISDRDKSMLFSTDGICISSYTLSTKNGDTFVTMIPKLFCEQLITWFREFKKGTLLFAKNCIQADFPEGFLYTQLDEEVEFLDFAGEFSKIFDSDPKFTTTPDDLEVVLDRSLLFSSSTKELDQFVDIEIEEGFMEIKTTTANGKINDEVDLKSNTEVSVFRMDAKLLKRAVRATKEITFGNIDNYKLFIGRDGKFFHAVNSFIK